MQIIKISINDSGQRIDKFLRKLLDKASLSMIFKILRTNQIKLNHKKVEPSHILNEDDEIRIYLDDEKIKLFSTVLLNQNNNKPYNNKNFDITKHIIYQDNNILALNKPPNIIVHPGGRYSHDETLIYHIHQYIKTDGLTFKPSFVHRLDRETSGVIIIALNMKTLQYLTKEIREGNVIKKYTLLAKDKIALIPDMQYISTVNNKKMIFTISAPILKTFSENGYHNVQISDDISLNPKKAITNIKVIKYFEEHTVCEATIETGRMHQIRLHMAYINHPVIGDDLYGDKKINKSFLQKYNLKRQFLHASSIAFIHPQTQKLITIEAPLYEDLRFILIS